MSYSLFRSHLATALDKGNDDHVPILVTRKNGQLAVLMSAEDVHSYQETAYLMASPANAKRLNRAIAEVATGRSSAHGLLEE